MLNLNKTYFLLFCLLVICLFVSPGLVPLSDEILAVIFLAVGFTDALYNKKWKVYMPLFIPLAVLFAYYIYSLLFCHFNIPKAITVDFFQHIKVFAYFGVSYGLGVQFSAKQKKILKILLAIIMAISLGVYSTLLMGTFVFYDIFVAHYYVGNVFLCSVVTFMLFLDSNDWRVIKKNIFYIILVALIGLTCGRSKYYGTVVFMFFMLMMYKPGAYSKFSWRNFSIIVSLIILVVAVAWQKINYYFLTDTFDVNTFDDESVSAFARPALYAGMIFVLIDYPILGSGFASFATLPSGPNVHYSSLYADYGLNYVWGLSEDAGAFIGDAFFPGIAQFGLVGFALFIMCFIWLGKKVKLIHRYVGIVPYITGVVIIVAILIDAVASRGITSIMGEYLFALMGMILSPIANLDTKAQKALKEKELSGTSVWNRVFNRKNKEKLIYGK